MTDHARPTSKLTKEIVESTPALEKPVYVWDAETKGFFLRVLPSGLKSFGLFYRNKFNRQRWHKIGRYPDWSVDRARREARSVRVLVDQGGDPSRVRDLDRNADTVDQLLDRYDREHLSRRNRESTAREFRRLMQNHIRPALGNLAVKDVSGSDVADLLHQMRDISRSANIVRTILSKVFNLAEQWGLRDRRTNPCFGLPRYEEVARNRLVSAPEMKRIGVALDAAEATMLPASLNAIRFLALSGCRLSEVLNLRRAQVDAVGQFLRLEQTKTRPRLHPLGSLAVAFLEDVMASHESEWVFPSQTGESPVGKSRVELTWRKLREAAGVPDVRLHDLRHTVGTVSARHAPNAFLVRDKLGHATTAMTNRYVHADMDPLAELSDKVESEIGNAFGIRATAKRRPPLGG